MLKEIGAFAFNFFGNSTQLEKVMHKVREDMTAMEAAITKFKHHVKKNLIDGFKNLALPVTGLLMGKELVDKIGQTVEFAKRMGDLAQRTGESEEGLVAWTDALQRTGGSAQAFEGTVDKLNSELMALDSSGRSRLTPLFHALGLSLTDSQGRAKGYSEVLLDLSTVFQQIGNVKAQALGARLGIDQGTITLLEQGRKSVSALLEQEKKLGGVSKDQSREAKALSESWADFKHVARTLGLMLGEFIVPTLTKIMNVFSKSVSYLREHLILVAGALVYLGLINATKIFSLITRGLIMTTRAAWSAAAAFFALDWPIQLIGVAILALILIFDDLITYLKGGKSLIGDWIASHEELAKKLHISRESIRALIHSVMHPLETWKNVFKWLIGFAIKQINRVKQAFYTLGQTILNIPHAMKVAFLDAFHAMEEKLMHIIDKVKHFFHFFTHNKKIKEMADQQAALINARTRSILQIPAEHPFSQMAREGAVFASPAHTVNHTYGATKNIKIESINIHAPAHNASQFQDFVQGSSFQEEMSKALAKQDDGIKI